MLGCQDFCGHYEWTFHYLRRRWGQDAVRRLWAEAIGGESQRHYAESAAREGLRGLYKQWNKTGVEEVCDWTWTLDEEKNILRWDMRECPSKGFLLQNDLQADEDYCDHCAGWMIPLLDEARVEVIEHEHNHCGQCWGTMRSKDREAEPSAVEGDIRQDRRWNHGYIHRWERGRPRPLLPEVCESSDPCEALAAWFADIDSLTILGRETGSREVCGKILSRDRLITTGEVYADVLPSSVEPTAVLIEGGELPRLAARYLAVPAERRPLLMHAFLPRAPMLDFVSFGLPRPAPILPLLIRSGLYVHQPGGEDPDTLELLAMVAAALRKRIILVGVDVEKHPGVGRLTHTTI